MATTGQGTTIARAVTLSGIRPIMFDPYAGDNKTELPAEKKFYGVNGAVVLPTENILSFLTAVNTTSAPKRLLDSREYRKVCGAFQSFVDIVPPDFIPFVRNGKPIKFGTFGPDNIDAKSGMFIDRRVARLEKGIPNPKTRPVLPLPWELHFEVRLYKNNEVNELMLKNIFRDGGITIGLGTYRGRYGKFEVTKWEEK